MKIRTLTSLAATLALGASLAACSADTADTAGDGTTKMTVGIIGIGSDAAITTAIDKGYFADEGLEVETTVVANPPAGIAAAQSGQLAVTYTPSIPVINALSQNVDLKVIAAADGYDAKAMEDKDPYQVDDTALFVKPGSGITRPKDLEGKKVAVPARKAQIEVTVANLVVKDGGDPTKINWMALDPASSLQSLEQGRVDAAGLVAPFSTNAKTQGMDLLGNPGLEFFGPGAVGLWVAGSKQVTDDPESMAAFTRAIYRANAYANGHPEEMDEVAVKITGIDAATIREGAQNYWPLSVELDDLQNVSAKLAELGYLTPEVSLNDDLIFKAK